MTSLLKEYRRPKVFNSVISPSVKNNYQLDIMVYNRYMWNKYKYILVIVDVYSRYAMAKALTNVTGDNLLSAIKELFDKYGYPKNLNLDNQFNTKDLNKFFEKNDVTTYFSYPDEINKNAIVERFNRTLAKMIQKRRVLKKKYNWPAYLDEIINEYNNKVHSRILAKPIDVWNGKDENHQEIVRLKKNLKVGDIVRYLKKKDSFEKGDKIMYSKDLYEIDSIEKNKYVLKHIDSDEVLDRKFKEYELTKVNPTKEQIEELIEDIDPAEEKQHKETQKKEKTKRTLKREGLDVDDEGKVKVHRSMEVKTEKRQRKQPLRFIPQ